MHDAHIENATRCLGAPPDWDKEKQGACSSLWVRDERTDAGPCMASAWYPTPEELQRLIGGAAIHLWIFGSTHPPVALTVGARSEFTG